MLVAIASMALLGMIYFFIRSFITLFRFFVWKSKVNAVGLIKEIKDVKINYSGGANMSVSSFKYIYSLGVDVNGNEYLVDYTETTSGTNPIKRAVGSSIAVYADINKKIAKNAKDMKSEIWGSPLGFLGCTAMLILSFLLASGFKG